MIIGYGYAFFIKIAVFIIILILIASAIIYYKFIMYKSSSYFEQKLIDIFYNLNLHKKNISILIGDHKIRKNLFDLIYVSYGFQKIKIENIDNDGQIDFINIAVFDNTVVFNIVEYENLKYNKSIYTNFIEVLRKYLNHNIIFNSIILVLDSDIANTGFNDNNKDMIDCASYIIDSLLINIPVYIIVNSNLQEANCIPTIMDSEQYSRSIGVGIESYKTGTIYHKHFITQIKTIVSNIRKLCLLSIINNSNIESNIMMTVFPESFESMINSSIEGVCSAINKMPNCKRIVVRFIIFTFMVNVGGANRYLFLDELFSNMLDKEKGLVYFGIQNVFINRNKTTEILMIIFSVVTLFYLSIAANFYIDNCNFIVSDLKAMELSSVRTDNNSISVSINAINKILLKEKNKSRFNIFYLLSEIYNDYSKKMDNKINIYLTSIYNALRNDIVNFILDNLVINNNQGIDIQEITNNIRLSYAKFGRLIDIHNNINPNLNATLQLCVLNNAIKDIDTNVDDYVDDKYSITQYRKININEFNTFEFSKNVVNNALELADKNHPIQKIQKLNGIITMLFTSNDIVQILDCLNNFKVTIESINLKNILQAIELKQCFNLVDELFKIKYISEQEAIILKQKINYKVNKYRDIINKSENKLIGKLIKHEDGILIFSNILNNINNNVNKVMSSNTYKRLVTHLENAPLQVSGQFKLIVNLENIMLLINDYNSFEQTAENNYIDNEFKKIFMKIVNTEMEHTWNESVVTIGNIVNASDKYINQMKQNLKNYYENYRFVFYNAVNSQFSTLSNNIEVWLSSYINTLYDKVKNSNILKNQSNLKYVSDNYFSSLFGADSKYIYVDKVENAIKELQDLVGLFEENIFLIRQYSQFLLDSGLNSKVDYLYTLIMDMNEYKKDNANSTIGKLKKFILDSYDLDKLKLIDEDKFLSKDKSYISDIHSELVKKFNDNTLKCRRNSILDDWNKLRNLCLEQQNVFPINFSSDRLIDTKVLTTIIDYSLDIIDKAIEYSRTENSKMYDNIITKLYVMQELSDLLEMEVPITIGVSLSNNLQSVSSINIRLIDNNTGKETIYTFDKKRSELNFYLNMESNVEIILGPILQNMINYKPSSNDNMIIGENAIIQFNSPGYINLIHKSISSGNKVGSIMNYEATIPLSTISLAVNKAEYKKTDAFGTLSIRIISDHRVINALKNFNNILQNIIKDKIF
ncbi:hypothetical protein IOLA_104 [uncultured bacterium]|nr:hypothetical protein IOLA_104 [uncultured bacterium]